MSLSTLSSKMRPLLQRSSRLVGGVVAKQQQQPSLMITRPMTVISKKSSEEYKQLVSFVTLELFVWFIC